MEEDRHERHCGTSSKEDVGVLNGNQVNSPFGKITNDEIDHEEVQRSNGNTVDKVATNGVDDILKKKNYYEPLTMDDLLIHEGENHILRREELMRTCIYNVFENNNVLFLYCKYVLLVYGKDLIDEKNIDLLNFQIIKGGITNILVKLQDLTTKNKYLIRLYGPKTNEIINREREKKIASILCGANISKKIYTFFPNGRIEEYMEGYTLTKEDIKNEKYQKKIAERLRLLHNVYISDEIFEQLLNLQQLQGGRNIPEKGCDKKKEQEKEKEKENNVRKGKEMETGKGKVDTLKRTSFLWPLIWKYFWLLRSEKNSVHSFNSKLSILNLIDFEKLEITIKEVEQLCAVKNSPVVLCHCDLLSSNILSKTNGDVVFIDFEYSCPVERAFDIANHFNEYAGFNCEWDCLPTKSEEYNFLKHYLQTENPILINSLINEIQPFYLSSHIYWGLWALLQATHSAIDFDFVSYAVKRLTALYLPLFAEKLNVGTEDHRKIK